jgi:glutathione S-transferase
MVLQEKDADFEAREVDLQNKSEEFLRVSPTGKVPVLAVDGGDALYESNAVNQYLDEVYEGRPLLPEEAKERAFARVWMVSADESFYPGVFKVSFARERGEAEEELSEPLEKLGKALSAVESRLDGRDYLAGEFSLADIAHAGAFKRLRDLDEGGDVSLSGLPNVSGWMQRVEERESYHASL